MRQRDVELFLPAEGLKVRRRPALAFLRGLADGLGAAAAIAAPPGASVVRRRRYEGRGLEDDWAAIGDDIRRAMASAG